MTSSAAGNNALTKSDNENNFPINFQPIPKRFIVWDKIAQDFVSGDGKIKVFDAVGLGVVLMGLAENGFNIVDGFEIIQSTDLFDKDGKEIFEGTIVEDEFNETLGYVYYEPEVCAWRIKFNDDEEDDGWTLENSTLNLRSVGHILTDPELLEDENV